MPSDANREHDGPVGNPAEVGTDAGAEARERAGADQRSGSAERVASYALAIRTALRELDCDVIEPVNGPRIARAHARITAAAQP